MPDESGELETALADARRAGQFESTGTFTLEPGNALQRLGADFSRLYPGEYLLKFIQGGVAASCLRIEVKCTRHKATVWLSDSSSFQALTLELAGAVNGANISGPRSVKALFALGIAAALADGAEKVEWTCAGEGGLWVSGDELSLTSGSALDSGAALTVHRPSKRRRLELELVERRCGFCPVDLRLNGRSLRGTGWPRLVAPSAEWAGKYAPSGFRLVERYLPAANDALLCRQISLPEVSARDYCSVGGQLARRHWIPKKDNAYAYFGTGVEKARGALALGIGLEGPNRVYLVQDGVLLDRITLKSDKIGGALLVLEAGELQTDLSGLRVVRDMNFENHIWLCRRELNEMRGLDLEYLRPAGRWRAKRAEAFREEVARRLKWRTSSTNLTIHNPWEGD